MEEFILKFCMFPTGQLMLNLFEMNQLFFSRKNDRVGVYLNHKTYVYVEEAIIKMFRTSIHQNMYHFNLIYGQS